MTDHSAVTIIKSFYGMSPPDERYIVEHEKKVRAIIKKMGDKYLLSNRVEKKSNGKI